MDPYLKDILSQPETLRAALDNFKSEQLISLARRLAAGEFDRIVITGMGASYNASYPAMPALSQMPVPVMLVNTAELLHYQPGLVGGRTLLWMISQSGRSAELVNLVEKLHTARPGFLLTCTNDFTSPLAQASDLDIQIHAGTEFTVSTKTYINTLATLLLNACVLTGGNEKRLSLALRGAADAMQVYLENWRNEVATLDELFAEVESLPVLGRGLSMSAVWNGTLILKEAAKIEFEGMHAADFRHGPLEMVEDGFSAFILAGAETTIELNRELSRDIRSYGGRVFWLGSQPEKDTIHIPIPVVDESALPLLEILPFQMLTLALAPRRGVEAGHFRHVGKITTRE